MNARVGIAALAAAWLARSGSPDAEEEAAKAPADAIAVASARVTPGRAIAVGPAMPRLEPPALVDANPELPPTDPRTIHGAIYELGGDPCVGATVVATSPALQGEQVVITDEDGRYNIGGLPRGEYTLVVYYNNERLSVAGYEVRDDEPTVAELVFDPLPEPPHEVVTVEPPSQIDGIYVVETLGPPETYEKNVPTGRNFADVLDCPDGGCTFHSNCGGENTYIVTSDDDTENSPTTRDFADELAIPSESHEGIAIDNNDIKGIPIPGRTFDAVLGAAAGSQSGG